MSSAIPSPASAEKPSRDHGCLPPWTEGDLPEPLAFSLAGALRTIGPGAILLAGSIGGGEWIVGPHTAIQYGQGILWIATVAIVLQAVFNLEGIRYTMYTGEPILTGVMRLRPGPVLWGPVYIVLAVAQLGAPALAAACATVLFSAFAGRVPAASGDDNLMTALLTVGVLIAGILLLLSGRTVERMLERLSWLMVAFIFTFLIVVNVAFVPLETWVSTASGFFEFGYMPAEMNLLLLSAFASTAGSGGIGNIAITNWFRDKGFGMGQHVGGIGGLLAHGEEVSLASVGRIFPVTADNMRRWRTWWAYARVDQMLLWAVGCAVGMFLNVNLAVHIFPADAVPNTNAMGSEQAKYLATFWNVLWPLTLLNGFWILFSTHIGNTDVLVRTVCDTLWAGFPRMQRWSPSRTYAVLLGSFSVFGLIAINFGGVKTLFEILGAVASIVTALAAVQILIVNARFLPREVQPRMWRRVVLAACGLFYGTISAALIYKQIASWWQ